MAKINFEDKEATRSSTLPRKNKVTADDLNEIKSSVNFIYDNGVESKKEYIALLRQTGTNDPTAFVLKNTLGGPVVWVRDSIGRYEVDLSSYGSTNDNTLINNKAAFSGTKTVMEVVGDSPEAAFILPYTLDGVATIEVINSDNEKIDLSTALGGTNYAVKIEIFTGI
jgi:hypothetical protein